MSGTPPEERAASESSPTESDDSELEWTVPPRAKINETPRVKEFDVNLLEGDERELAGENVAVEFHFPDGKTAKRTYVMGQTIADMKINLEDLFGLPYEKTVLKLNGKLLIDPLSLNDLPFKASEVNEVAVEILS